MCKIFIKKINNCYECPMFYIPYTPIYECHYGYCYHPEIKVKIETNNRLFEDKFHDELICEKSIDHKEAKKCIKEWCPLPDINDAFSPTKLLVFKSIDADGAASS